MTDNKPKVYCITLTYGRHKLLERAMRCFIDQDYQGDHTMLIYNNSPHPQQLHTIAEDLPPNKHIILINNNISKDTGEIYTDVGNIFRDALSEIPDDVEIVNIMDDDDIYLSNHISEGVEGYLRAKSQHKTAYKPKFSWFRSSEGIRLAENIHEPSIFVNKLHLEISGFSLHSASHHMQWLQPLIDDNMIFIDLTGVPTFVYDWSGELFAFKVTGDPDNPHNFDNHKKSSKDEGDGILTPWTRAKIKPYYITEKKEEILYP